MARYAINPITGKLDFTTDAATTTTIAGATGGYEFTGGFADRSTGATGASDVGSNVEYTAADVTAQRWLRFGLDSTRQLDLDKPYWQDAADNVEAPGARYDVDINSVPDGYTWDAPNNRAIPDSYQGTGLFSGAYMPEGVTSLFNFSENGSYNQAEVNGGNPYTAAIGSFDFSQCRTGDLALIRFDFNIIPQFANTTVEVGLIWSTRDTNDNITFTFPLLTSPIYFGAGTVGNVYLNRPVISAYFASGEDVNARALPAIRADQPVLVQPLTTLVTIQR